LVRGLIFTGYYGGAGIGIPPNTRGDRDDPAMGNVRTPGSLCAEPHLQKIYPSVSDYGVQSFLDRKVSGSLIWGVKKNGKPSSNLVK